MINKLKKQEEELKSTIKAWEEYQNSPKKHYNIPIPRDLIHEDYKYCNPKKEYLDEYKSKLAYLKEVCKVYDNTDFIVTETYHMGRFRNAEDIKYVHITPEIRKRIHDMCNTLEKDIKAIENPHR